MLPISLFSEYFSVSRPVNSPDGSDTVGRLVILAEIRPLRQQIFEYLLVMLTVAFAVTMLAIGLAMRLQRTISGPVKELARVTARVSESADYGLRVEPESSDEVGQLYVAFNSLMQRVQDREAETKLANQKLQEAHDELDLRVQERTRQLEKANALLSDLLDEKETLLREVHHRVKNNLNVVTSLLSLQGRDQDGMVDVSILREARQRIKTMSLVHETLYSTSEFGELSAHECIDRVVESLKKMYDIEQRHIVLRVDTQGIGLNVMQAIPIGLIVNELVTNAIKYAFDGRDCGIVEVEFREAPGSILTLRVSDDGIGIPDMAVLHNSPTLGFKLVKALVQQIRGKLSISGAPGTSVEISFRRADGAYEEDG